MMLSNELQTMNDGRNPRLGPVETTEIRIQLPVEILEKVRAYHTLTSESVNDIVVRAVSQFAEEHPLLLEAELVSLKGKLGLSNDELKTIYQAWSIVFDMADLKITDEEYVKRVNDILQPEGYTIDQTAELFRYMDILFILDEPELLN